MPNPRRRVRDRPVDAHLVLRVEDLVDVAVGDAAPELIGELHPSEVRLHGADVALSRAEAARVMRGLALISRAFGAALPDDVRQRIRDEIAETYMRQSADILLQDAFRGVGP